MKSKDYGAKRIINCSSTLLPNLKISEDIQIGLTVSGKHLKNNIHVCIYVLCESLDSP